MNTRAFVVDGDGTGFLLGGVSDPSTAQPYIGGEDAPTLGAVPSVRRLEKGALAAQPPDEASQLAETPTPPGAVRLGFGGHAACLDRCGGAGGQGYAPDTHLQSAITRVREMVGGGAGPAALVIGGGRASLGGDPLDVGGARRYRALTEGAGVPTYVVPGPGDSPDGGADAFASAFASAPAPQGSGETPTGVDLATVSQPRDPDPARARGTFAFDVHAPAGTVRVIVIDNAAGRLAGGLDGPQAQWVRDALEQARGQGIASVVAGSVPLDDTQSAKPAADAADELALLAGHASAYIALAGVDDPSDPHFGGVLAQSTAVAPGSAAPLALLQSSTLGYAPAQNFTNGPVDLEEAIRQSNAALLMVDVAVDRMDASTGVAPVSAVAEPLLEGLSLDQASRSVPLGWVSQLYVTATDPSPRRFLMTPSADQPLRPASPGSSFGPLIDQCRFFVTACTTVVASDMTFASSNPQIARFVAIRPGREASQGRPEVVTDASGHVIDDPRGFLCPLALGTVDVAVTALGRRISTPVEVVPVPKLGNGNIRSEPIPEGTCGFPSFTRTDDQPTPTATPETPTATTPPVSAPAPSAPVPGPHHAPAKPHPAPPVAASGAQRHPARRARRPAAPATRSGHRRSGPPTRRPRTQAPGPAGTPGAPAGPPGPAGPGPAAPALPGHATGRAAPGRVRPRHRQRRRRLRPPALTSPLGDRRRARRPGPRDGGRNHGRPSPLPRPGLRKPKGAWPL